VKMGLFLGVVTSDELSYGVRPREVRPRLRWSLDGPSLEKSDEARKDRERMVWIYFRSFLL